MINTTGVVLNDWAIAQLARCIDFLEHIKDTDERARLEGTLQHCFDIINRLGGGQLGYDFAPLSFGFQAGGFVGGLIFHGPTDGSGPNFSVSLERVTGWTLHT